MLLHLLSNTGMWEVNAREESVSLMDTALGPLFPVELDRATPYGHGTPWPAALSMTEADRDNA